MKTVSILSAMLIFLSAANVIADDPPNIVIKDAVKLMHKNLAIPTNIISSGKCSNRTGCRKYCAKRPICYSMYDIRNLNIVDLLSIDYKEPDPANFPWFAENLKVRSKNCGSASLTWKETLKYSSSQTIRTEKKEVIQNVKQHKADIALSGKFLEDLGIKVTSSFSNSTTFTITNAATESNEDTFTLTKEYDDKVPSLKERLLLYSDSKRRVRIPVRIEAVLNGDLYSVEYIQGSGEVWAEHFQAKLHAKGDASKRTVTVEGEIVAQGSDRILNIEVYERDLTSDECTYPGEGSTVSGFDSSFDKSKWTRIGVRENSGEICDATAKLDRFDQNGNEASAIFKISVEDQCLRHSGVIEFTTISRKSDRLSLSAQSLQLRQESEYWSNESDDDFLLEWNDFSHLDDDEELLDIGDVEVQQCNCIVRK